MVDRGYADFVRERQAEMMRAAALVAGGPQVGRSILLEALVELARHWAQVRGAGADAHLRRELYRRAVHVEPGRSGDAVASLLPADLWEGDVAEQRHRVVQALARLTPLQRAVLVDRSLEGRGDADTAEVLGLDPATERAALEDALRRLSPLVGVGSGGPRHGPDPDEEVWHLLELASDDVPEEDLVEEAWSRAAAQRRRVGRRTVLGAVAVGAVGVGAAVALDRFAGEEERTAAPTLASVDVAGAHVLLAVRPDEEPRLLRYPDSRALGLPERVGPGDPASAPRLTTPLDAPLRAVYLVAGPRGLEVVLDAPQASPRHRLVAPGRADGLLRPRDHLGPRTIATDRHRVVLPSTDGLVVIDPRVRAATHLHVPDAALTWAAWAGDDHTVVATSIHTGWVVDTRSGAVQEVGLPICGGQAVLGAPGEDLEVVDCAPSGLPRARRAVRARGLVPTVESPCATNGSGWVAGEVFIGGEAQDVTGCRSGLVAVPPVPGARPALLAASGRPVDGHRLRVLAWADEATLLLESRSQVGAGVHRVLAWDVAADRLWAVAEVEPADARTWFSGLYAL